MTRRIHLRWLIYDCPPSLAACESDCRNTRCTVEHAEKCQLRIETQRAIEREQPQ